MLFEEVATKPVCTLEAVSNFPLNPVDCFWVLVKVEARLYC